MMLLDGLQWEEVVAARAAAAAAAAAEAAQAAAEEAAAGDADGAAGTDGDATVTANGDAAAAAPPVAPPAAPPAPLLQVRTFVDDLFGGMLASTIVCGTCHTASTCMEPFMDVSLPIPAPAAPPPSAFTFNSRFSAFAGTAAAQKRQPSKMAATLADAAEARAAAAANKKKDKAAEIAAAAAAAKDNIARVRMNGKERKKAEKLARRNAKRMRKPRAGSAKAASSDPDVAGPSTAPDSPRSNASSTTSSSGGEGDDDDELSDASSPAPSAAAAAAAAADSDSDSDGAQQPPPAVITLGPPPAPSSADDDWLEMVDDSVAAAEEAAKLKSTREADAADADVLDFAAGAATATAAATISSSIIAATSRLSALSPLRMQPLSELAAVPIIAPLPQPPEASPEASVLSCLAAFVADEQLTGACRYACEACARAAAASAAARGAKSVRWAPKETLESVRLIPPRPDDDMPPPCSSESEDDANADPDALLLPLPSALDAEDEGAAGGAGSGPLRDLASRFDEAAGDVPEAEPDADAARAATDSTLAAAAAGLEAMTLSGGACGETDAAEEGSEPAPAPDATSSPPGDAQPEVASESPPPGAAAGDDAPVAATPAPSAPPPVLRDAVKRLRFAQLPRCLVVHLKRFRQDARGRTSKIGGHVAFEESLDLAPYWSPPPPPPAGAAEGAATAEAPPPLAAPPSLYRLQGVVEHSGGLHGGHYVAFVRRGGDWHYASDRHVRPATLAQALSAEAYLLFYARDDVVAAANGDAHDGAPGGEATAQGHNG